MVELREVMAEFERLVKEMDGYVGEDISLDTEALALTSQVWRMGKGWWGGWLKGTAHEMNNLN